MELPPLSLYVHLPWCVSKCPYCDFNSHAVKGGLPGDQYVQALLKDLELELPLVWGRAVHSIFFGGGTPSLFSAEQIATLMSAAIRSAWCLGAPWSLPILYGGRVPVVAANVALVRSSC